MCQLGGSMVSTDNKTSSHLRLRVWASQNGSSALECCFNYLTRYEGISFKIYSDGLEDTHVRLATTVQISYTSNIELKGTTQFLQRFSSECQLQVLKLAPDAH